MQNLSTSPDGELEETSTTYPGKIKSNVKPMPPNFFEKTESFDSEVESDTERMTFPSRNSPQRASVQDTKLLNAPTSQLQKKRQKVILEPGHSALDWARLQTTLHSNVCQF